MERVERSRGGFTILEVLVTILIVTILATMVIPHIVNAAKEAKEANLRSTLQELRNAIAIFHSHTGGYPAQLEDLMAPRTAPPANGITETGASIGLNINDYQGPYLCPDKPVVPINVVTSGNVVGTDWLYTTTPPDVGDVHAAAGTATDGSDYSTW